MFLGIEPFRKNSLILGYLLGVRILSDQNQSEDAKGVLFLPLDERFTTRDAFLNLAKTTPFDILTPPVSLLPHLKVPGDLIAVKLISRLDSSTNYTAPSMGGSKNSTG
jgi:hypothetical protein